MKAPSLSSVSSSVLAVALALTFSGPTLALQNSNTEGAGPAQRSPLDRPPPTNPNGPGGGASAAAPAANAPRLVPGKYLFKVAVANRSLTEEVQLARSGDQVTLTLPKGEVLSGSINASGQFVMSVGSGSERLSINSSAGANSANGTAQVKVGTQTKTGTFSLTEVQKSASVKGPLVQEKMKVQQFKEPGGGGGSGGDTRSYWQRFKDMFTL